MALNPFTLRNQRGTCLQLELENELNSLNWKTTTEGGTKSKCTVIGQTKDALNLLI